MNAHCKKCVRFKALTITLHAIASSLVLIPHQPIDMGLGLNSVLCFPLAMWMWVNLFDLGTQLGIGILSHYC